MALKGLTIAAKLCAGAILLVSSASAMEQDHLTTIHLAGDSTMAARKSDSRVQSWGEVLRLHVKRGVSIRNCGKSGTSTETYRRIWEDDLIGKVKEGDFVIIQFGHNDQWPTEKKLFDQGEPERFCTPAQYGRNIRRYIAEVRACKATPILLSTTPVRDFSGEDGRFTEITERKRPYMEMLSRIAEEDNVDFVDMLKIGNRVIAALGSERSKQLYICAFEGTDNVHPNECGARIFAELFLAEIRSRKLSISGLFPFHYEEYNQEKKEGTNK